jgi:LPS-assembly protein
MRVREVQSAGGSKARLNRSGCLAGVALTLIAGIAQAKTLSAMAPQPSTNPKPAVAAPDDGLAGGGFYLEADTLAQSQATHHIIATGGVEIRYKGRVLRAEKVDYDTQTGVVIATGKVRILQADGAAQFAETLSLDKTMSEGFAIGFSTRMQGHVQIAAESTERKSADVTEFHHVIYTPCLDCVANGQKHPTWSIRARSVIEDKKHESLVFKGAVVQVLGQDILYIPILESADPTADHKNGLLLPMLTFSGPRGASYEQPYYIHISNSQDILITPQINSLVNPFLQIDWRKQFYSGNTEVRAGYTYDYDFTSGSDKFGQDTSRSYILANGQFQQSSTWSWGFTAEQTSDKLLFEKYSVTDVFTTSTLEDRGLYAADDQRLISQLYAVRQDSNSYLSAAAVSIQGLRTTDLQSTFPIVAPLIESRWEAPDAILGGRLRLDASAVALTANQSLSANAPPDEPLIPGVDSRRTTLQGDWQTNFRFSNGLLVQPFANARADLYNITNIPNGPSDATILRGFGTLGATVSYPLIKPGNGVNYILEPVGQIAISPNISQDPRIPNEDSVDFQFDETNLFDSNRSPGYDLIEGGQSLTLAGRATALFDDGRSASILVGRRLAAEDDSSIPTRTGLETALSDWIFAADATPWKGIRLFARMRLDSSTFALNALETGASFTTSRVEGSISYLDEAEGPAGVKVNSLDIHDSFFATKNWGLTNYLIVDGGAWRRTEVGVVYRDDCIRVEVIYRHDETFNGTLGPSTSVVIRLKLATLGNTR